MADRPYTLLSCGISMDGYLDTGTMKRLLLSNDADFERVDAVRASYDAILVGAATVRNDDPRLVVRSPARREARRAQGRTGSPVKVTVTAHGLLDPAARFFTAGDAEKLVYCASSAIPTARKRIGSAATIVDGGVRPSMRSVAEDLHDRSVRRLMVEGGGSILTQFLTEDLADELHLVIAPMFVGDPQARRFVGEGRFPWNPHRRATLAGVEQIGDVVLLRYQLSHRFSPDPVGVR